MGYDWPVPVFVVFKLSLAWAAIMSDLITPPTAACPPIFASIELLRLIWLTVAWEVAD